MPAATRTPHAFPQREREDRAPLSVNAPTGGAERTPRAGIVCARAAWGPQRGAPAGGPVSKGRSAGLPVLGSLSGQSPSGARPLPRRRDGAPGGQEGALKEGRRALVPAVPDRVPLQSANLREWFDHQHRARGAGPPRRGNLRRPLGCV